MIVKELIEKLQTFNEDLEVKRYCEGGQFSISTVKEVEKEYEKWDTVVFLD